MELSCRLYAKMTTWYKSWCFRYFLDISARSSRTLKMFGLSCTLSCRGQCFQISCANLQWFDSLHDIRLGELYSFLAKPYCKCKLADIYLHVHTSAMQVQASACRAHGKSFGVHPCSRKKSCLDQRPCFLSVYPAVCSIRVPCTAHAPPRQLAFEYFHPENAVQDTITGPHYKKSGYWPRPMGYGTGHPLIIRKRAIQKAG